jgi:hypothetical protein
MRNIYRLALVLIASIGLNLHVIAQCDPVLRTANTQWIFNGSVLTSAKVGNTMYVGGNFTTLSKNIGKLISLDALSGSPLNLATWPAINGNVNAIVSDGSGGFLIGGNFTQVGASARNGIAQISAVGSVSAWNPNCNGTVTTIFRSGTTVYVGGAFTAIGGQSRNNIAAVSLSTGLATSWAPNANAQVNDIVVTGTTVYMGGLFTQAGGQFRDRIASIDATTGLAFAWDPGSNGTVNTIMVSGTTVYIGGSFSVVAGVNRSNAAAISNTGIATSWNPAPNNDVYDIALSGASILVGGEFSVIGTQSRAAIAEVDASIGNATSANYGLPLGAIVRNIKVLGNDVYIAGSFTLGSGQMNLAKINKALATVATWEANLGNGNPTVVELNATGSTVYVGGTFSNFNRNRSRIAAIDVLTDTLKSWNPGANNTVNAIAANASSVFVGGTFTIAGGQNRSRLAAVDATTGVATAWNPAPTSTVNSLLLNGTSLYVGGSFTTIAATSRQRVAEFDISTGALTTWNPSANGTVLALAYSGSDIYLGGSFTTVSSTGRNRVASVSNAGVLTGWNPNADNVVNTLAVSGTSLYVGGSFNNIGGQFRPRIAELNLSTGNATSWNPYASGPVSAIAVDGSRVYAGGVFSTIGGQTRDNLAALDKTTGNATPWTPSPDAMVSHLAVYSGRLLAGGNFLNISATNYTYGTQYKLVETAPSVTISGRSVICSGNSVTFTAFTDVTGASYQWKRNGSNVGTNSPTYVVVPANNDQIQVVVTVPGGSCYTAATATSNTITVTVSSPTTPTASIAGNTTVCQGTLTTYTLTTNIPNGTYVWRVNGNIAATNTTSFSFIPQNNDFINCSVTVPSEGCYSTTTVFSNAIFITVNAPVPPAISIATPNTTVCAGSNVTFTSTTNVTGGSYQWKVNGLNVGTNSSTYSTTTLANGNIVSCVITIPVGGCFSSGNATSNSITMTVNPVINATLSISGNTTPCIAALTTYTATTNITSPSYQWKRNGFNVGINSSTLSIVPANNDVITCVVTPPPGTCYSPAPITSNSLTINPQSAVTTTISISGSTTVCQGSSATYTATTSVTGGTFQWKVNNINTGLNTSTLTYSPSNGDVVTCVITVPAGVGCWSASSVTSNSLNITVTPPATPSVSIATNPTGTTTVCAGTQVTYEVASTNVTGGTYQWRVNGFDILGATGSTFNYTPSNNDVIAVRVTVPGGSCFSPASGLSTGIAMTVTPAVVPGMTVTPSANNVCDGVSVTFNASTNVVGGTFQWQVNGFNVGTNSTIFSYVPIDGDVVTCTVTVPGTGCFTVPTATNGATMTVQPLIVPTVTTTASATTVCAGETVTYNATTNITGAFFQWKVNGSSVGTNNPVFSYEPIDDDIVLCIITTPQGCYASPTAASIIIVMTVTPPATHNFFVGAQPIAEVGSTVTVGANVDAAIGPYSIEWKNKGTTFATTTTSTATYTKGEGIDTITAIITPDNSCYATITASEAYVHAVPTNIRNISKGADINIYPNPFTNYVSAKGLSKGDHLALIDATGHMLMSWTVDSDKNEQTFDIRDLPGGSYMIRVSDKDYTPKAHLTLQKL